jgi:hypothetical protein
MRKKGLMIGVMAVLLISILIPAYAQTQSGDPVQDRDQDCEPNGPATRTYGEETSAKTQEKKLEVTKEESLESGEELVQEQTQSKEQLRDGEGEEGEHYQHRYQDRFGQEEAIELDEDPSQEQTQSQEQSRNGEGEEGEQYQYRYQDRFGQEE